MAAKKRPEKKRFVLCFGSANLQGDDLALRFAKKMKVSGHAFVLCDSPEQVLAYLEEDFVVLDAAQGIRKVTLLEDASRLQANRLVSLHDFDAAYFLKLAEAMHPGTKVRIIAIPLNSMMAKAESEVKRLLLKLSKQG